MSVPDFFVGASNGQADALVTYQVSDFHGLGDRFKIMVMTPAQLLKKVKYE